MSRTSTVKSQKIYRTDVPITINRIVALFYKLRVWNRNDELSICSTVLKLLQAIHFLWFVASNITAAAITPNMQQVVFLSDFSILTATHAVRMVYIMWKQEEILKFIDEIGIHSTEDFDEFVRIKSRTRDFLKFADCFVLACSGEVTLVIIVPMISGKPIIDTAFFWEKTSLAFWTSHTSISLGCIYSVIWFLLSVIIWYLMLNCAFQYQLLGNQLKSIGSKNSGSLQQKSFVGDLIKAIKVHRRIYW